MQMTKPMKHFHSLILIIAALLMAPAVASAQGKVYKPHPERQKVEQPKATKPKSGKSKKNNKPAPIKKDVPAQSQAPETTPVPQPAPPVKQQPQPKPKPAFTPRTTYNNLDLQAVRDGQTCYISQLEWVTMSDAEHSRYDRKGVVVVGSVVDPFVVDLYDSGEDMTWEEAMNIYGDSLPSLEQAEEMARQYEEINAAILAFGGDNNPNLYYWTKVESDPYCAWFFDLFNGGVNPCNKIDASRVRAVAPVPPSSAM